MNAKELTIKRFTNLLDGKVYNASVTQIIEYYEAQLKGSNPVVKTNCSITNNFLDAEYAEYEEDENCY
jgi:hypothetical protein